MKYFLEIQPFYWTAFMVKCIVLSELAFKYFVNSEYFYNSILFLLLEFLFRIHLYLLHYKNWILSVKLRKHDCQRSMLPSVLCTMRCSPSIEKAWLKCRSVCTKSIRKCYFKFVNIKCESRVCVVYTMYYLDVSLLVHLSAFRFSSIHVWPNLDFENYLCE